MWGIVSRVALIHNFLHLLLEGTGPHDDLGVLDGQAIRPWRRSLRHSCSRFLLRIFQIFRFISKRKSRESKDADAGGMPGQHGEHGTGDRVERQCSTFPPSPYQPERFLRPISPPTSPKIIRQGNPSGSCARLARPPGEKRGLRRGRRGGRLLTFALRSLSCLTLAPPFFRIFLPSAAPEFSKGPPQWLVRRVRLPEAGL